MLIDSHCHLNYLDDPRSALERAREAGIATCLCISVDEAGFPQVLALAKEHPDVWATAGVHPDAAAGNLDWIEGWLGHERVVAVGETGLDYLHAEDSGARQRQRQAFDLQLDLAQRHDLPVVVHTRGAEADTLDALKNYPGVRGVLHCFTESWQMAEEALDLGFHISMSGIVTFKNAENVREVARQIPLERLLVETDAPWLAPVPRRGKTNEPGYVAHTACFLAGLRGCAVDDLARATTQNFRHLFRCGELPSDASSAA